MMTKYKISENDIWDDEEKSIWNAKLFTVEKTNNDSIKSAIELYNIMNCKCDEKTAKNYFKKKREMI